MIDGRPSVSVPVLSNITVSIRPTFSNTSALRSKMPSSAARLEPKRIAMGVAKPKAHGQATANTETKTSTAKKDRGSGPKKNQIAAERVANTSTVGTNHAATRSTILCTGDFD